MFAVTITRLPLFAMNHGVVVDARIDKAQIPFSPLAPVCLINASRDSSSTRYAGRRNTTR
jgi:hypothetical protein